MGWGIVCRATKRHLRFEDGSAEVVDYYHLSTRRLKVRQRSQRNMYDFWQKKTSTMHPAYVFRR